MEKIAYYLKASWPEDMLCKVHTSRKRELELFCHQCRACICLECKIETHSTHVSQDVRDIYLDIKNSITPHLQELGSTMAGLRDLREAFSREKQAVLDKKAAVKKAAEDRHRLMVSMADKCRDDALLSLKTITDSICSQLDMETQGLDGTLDSLEKLKRRMDGCLEQGTGKEGSRLIVTARDIYSDADTLAPEVQVTLATKRVTTVFRPVLRHAVTADIALPLLADIQKQFMGRVENMEMAVNVINVSVRQVFKCEVPQGQSCKIYSLFPTEDDDVWLAYDDADVRDDSPGRHPELRSSGGSYTKQTDTSVRGRVSFMHTMVGTLRSKQILGTFQTYPKARCLMKLENKLDGTGVISDVTLVSNENHRPEEVSCQPVCSIRCGPHRAFDVDESRTLFAVVEEAGPGPSQPWRQVRVYRRPQPGPVATYTPPVWPYQPSDVCFHRIAGHDVLLVADELNDVIHVVRVVGGGQLQFDAYLAVGSPLITQPTALNTDLRGRLWVGCRSGAVLLCEPNFSANHHDFSHKNL